jgi:hypothetical protein
LEQRRHFFMIGLDLPLHVSANRNFRRSCGYFIPAGRTVKRVLALASRRKGVKLL